MLVVHLSCLHTYYRSILATLCLSFGLSCFDHERTTEAARETPTPDGCC